MPALEGDSEKEISGLAEALWKAVSHTAQRQGWESIYKYISTGDDRIQPILARAFGLADTAIYPGYRSSAIRSRRHGHPSSESVMVDISPPVVVAQRALSPNSGSETPVYVPEQHLEMVRCLYEPLGLKRTFCASSEGVHEAPAIAADAQGVELRSFRHTGLCQLFVQPSLLSSFQRAAVEVDAARFNDCVVFVNLFDSRTPAFCEFLEENGFRFSGIVPLLQGRDSILYSRRRSGLIDEGSFSTAKAKTLASYIQSYSVDWSTGNLPSYASESRAV